MQSGAFEDKKTLDKFLGIMGTESIRMKRVIDDLLNLSRIEQYKHIIPDGEVNINNIVNSSYECCWTSGNY